MSRFIRVFVVLTTLLGASFSGLTYAAKDPIYTGLFNSVAVSGYDTVAYFDEGTPVEGSKKFEYEWMDATWRFHTAANLELFKKEPEKYAPQYGGYCAYAVSQNTTASTDPTKFHIKDGKLYLNYNGKVQKKWLAERDMFIVDADKNWPNVLN
ncbi:MAG: YHS domain protein [Gammaproteobacteria bacterium]|nr:MAG: YHS domain protein [Gammaproteobacteria bacterium]